MVADIDELELNSTPEGSMQRKCSRHREVETSYFLSQMEQSKSLG